MLRMDKATYLSIPFKKQVKILQGVPKKEPFNHFFDSFSPPNAKRLTIKAFLEEILVLFPLRAHIVF